MSDSYGYTFKARLRPLARITVLSVDGITTPDSKYCQLSVDGVCLSRLSGTSLSDDEAKYIHGISSREDTQIKVEVYDVRRIEASCSSSFCLWDAFRAGGRPLVFPMVTCNGLPSTIPITLHISIQPVTDNIPRIEALVAKAESEYPTLENLIRVLRLLKTLSKMNTDAYNLSHYYIGSMYLFLNLTIKEQSLAAKTNKVFDDEGRAINVKLIHGNALEDLLVQMILQLSCLEECFTVWTPARDIVPHIKSVGSEVFWQIARVSAIMCHYANHYFAASPRTVGAASAADYKHFTDAQRNFVYLGARVVYLCRGLDEEPPKATDSLAKALVSYALSEVRDPKETQNWRKLSFTSVLGSFRWINAQAVYQVLHDQYRSCWNNSDIDQRDAIRRLLAHIVQETDILPELLLRDEDELSWNPDEAHSKLGEGGYAEVWKGQLCVKGLIMQQKVAVKSLKHMDVGTVAERRERRLRLYLEMVNCWTLAHTNIVSLLAVSQARGRISLAFPEMTRGSMGSCFAALRDGTGLPTGLLDVVHRWIADISQGMTYLHTEGVVHGDLRASNVLISGDLTAKIADFGLSLFVHGHSQNYASRRQGNNAWLAPELLSRKAEESMRATTASDVYSFALVCVEAYTGDSPYPHLDETTTSFLRAILSGTRPPRPAEPTFHGMPERPPMNDKLWVLVTECWDGDKAARPTAVEVERRIKEFGYPFLHLQPLHLWKQMGALTIND